MNGIHEMSIMQAQYRLALSDPGLGWFNSPRRESDGAVFRRASPSFVPVTAQREFEGS
jgi:hypothetical protein